MRKTAKFTFLLMILLLLAGCTGPKNVSMSPAEPQGWLTQGWRSAALAPQNLGSTALAQSLESLLAKPIHLHGVVVTPKGVFAVDADYPQGFRSNRAGKHEKSAFQVSYQGGEVGITLRSLDSGGVALIYSGIQWPF
ncbi:hypothetical protein LSAC_01494 [Levilinea saccharolytica]|nr:hypothetical protein LSAC_01494 [Levilinea saccharolytica]